MQDRRIPQFGEVFLQRTAGPYIRVNRIDFRMSATCLLIPPIAATQRTCRHFRVVPPPVMGRFWQVKKVRLPRHRA
jgi:hypothetical protein